MRILGTLLLTLIPFGQSRAGVIAFFDFDPSAPEVTITMGVTSTPPTYSPYAAGASGYGGAFTLTQTVTGGAAAYIRGSFSSVEFDLAKIPGVTPGYLSVAHLDLLRFSFDANLIGVTQIDTLRFAASGVGRPDTDLALNVVDALNGQAGQGFKSYTVDFAQLDSALKQDFVTAANGYPPRTSPTTRFNIYFEFAQRDGMFYTGDSIVFDNLHVYAVPEPSTVTLALAAAGVAFAVRRLRVRGLRTSPPA